MRTILTLMVLIFIGCRSVNTASTMSNSINQIKEGVFEDCGPGGIEKVTYTYRIGTWILYHPNGQIKAQGRYIPIQTVISTRCELNEKLEFSQLDDGWKFFNPQGEEIEPTEQNIRELTCFTHEEDELFKIQYCFDKAQNRVVYDILKE